MSRKECWVSAPKMDTSGSVKYLLRIYFIMKLTGIYLNDKRTPRKRQVLYITYAIIAWLLSFIDVVRILLLFKKGDEFVPDIVNKMTALVAYSASLLVYTTCFFARNHFFRFIESWERIRHHRSKTRYCVDYSSHMSKVCIGLYVMIAIVPLSLLAYFIYYILQSDPEPNPKEILIPEWYKNMSVGAYRWLSIIHTILKSISTAAVCAYVALIVISSAILQKEFNTLKCQLEKTISENNWDYCIDDDPPENNGEEMAVVVTPSNNRKDGKSNPPSAIVEETRLVHDKITVLVGIADSIFSVCLGVALFLAMGMTILIMYNFAKSYDNFFTIEPFAIYVMILVIFAAGVQLTIIGSSLLVNIAVRINIFI